MKSLKYIQRRFLIYTIFVLTACGISIVGMMPDIAQKIYLTQTLTATYWTTTPTYTFTPTYTATATATLTPSSTPTSTETYTPTHTFTPSNTPTSTNTPTATHTPTDTSTPTNTPTQTPSATPSMTFTPSPTPFLCLGTLQSDAVGRAFPANYAPISAQLSAGPVEIRGYQGDPRIRDGRGWYVIRDPASQTGRLNEVWVTHDLITPSSNECGSLEYRDLVYFGEQQVSRRTEIQELSVAFEDSFRGSLSWSQNIENRGSNFARNLSDLLPFARLITSPDGDNPVISLSNPALGESRFAHLSEAAIFVNFDHAFNYNYPSSFFAIRLLRNAGDYVEVRIANNCLVTFLVVTGYRPIATEPRLGAGCDIRTTEEVFVEMYLLENSLSLYINDSLTSLPIIDRTSYPSGAVEFLYSGMGSVGTEPITGIHYIVVLGQGIR